MESAGTQEELPSAATFVKTKISVICKETYFTVMFGTDTLESGLTTIPMPLPFVFFQLLAPVQYSAVLLFYRSVFLCTCLSECPDLLVSLCSLFACLPFPPDGVTGKKPLITTTKNRQLNPNPSSVFACCTFIWSRHRFWVGYTVKVAFWSYKREGKEIMFCFCKWA